MPLRSAHRRATTAVQWRELLMLVEAAVALQPDSAAVIRRCLDRDCRHATDLARQVTRLTSGYAYLISRVDELPASAVTDEVARLLRYHHMLLAETARYSYNAPDPISNSRWRFDGDLGQPAARLRDLRELIAGFVDPRVTDG